jgi:hypothetical protein
VTAAIQPYILTEDFEAVYALILHEPYMSGDSFGFVIFLRGKLRSGRSTYQRVSINGSTYAEADAAATREIIRRFPESQRVSELLITRNALTELKVDGTRGFDLKFTSDFPVRCIAHSRPTDDFRARLEDWPMVRSSLRGILQCSITADARHAVGLLGHLVVTLLDEVQVLVCFGLNHNFQHLFVVLPFSKRTYCSQINADKILRAFNHIMVDQDNDRQIFDSERHMICASITDCPSEIQMDVGFAFKIDSGEAGKHELSIEFRVEEYIRHCLPAIDLHCHDPRDCLQRHDVDKMLELDSDIYAMRLAAYLC